jgi:hypothetical protein
MQEMRRLRQLASLGCPPGCCPGCPPGSSQYPCTAKLSRASSRLRCSPWAAVSCWPGLLYNATEMDPGQLTYLGPHPGARVQAKCTADGAPIDLALLKFSNSFNCSNYLGPPARVRLCDSCGACSKPVAAIGAEACAGGPLGARHVGWGAAWCQVHASPLWQLLIIAAHGASNARCCGQC